MVAFGQLLLNMRNLYEWVKSHFGQISTVLTIVGFSLVGLITSIIKIVNFIIRKKNARKDKKYFGGNLEIIRSLAVRDGCYNLKESKSLKKSFIEKKDFIIQKIRKTVYDKVELDISQIASGSSTIKFKEIINDNFLLLDSNIRNINSGRQTKFSSFINELKNYKDKSFVNFNKALLIGDAGEGKSLVCFVLRNKLKDLDSNKWVLFISHKDFLNNASISLGSEEWLSRLVASQIGIHSPSDLDLRVIDEIIKESSIIIIDAMDEIAQKISRERNSEFINSWCFKSSLLITTRETHFYSSLLGLHEIREFDVLSIEPTNYTDRQQFIEGVCKRLYSDNNYLVPYQRVIYLINNFSAIAQITQTPILLLMLCELAVKGNLDESLTTVTIYEHWVHEFTIKEIEKSHKGMSYSELLSLLEDIAWKLFLQINEGYISNFALTEDSIKDILSNKYHHLNFDEQIKITKLIVNSPLLTSLPTKTKRESSQILFRHESFFEYLIASRVNAWLLGNRTSGEDFFEMLETPGIAFFIKEYFLKIKESPEYCYISNRRLLQYLEQLLTSRSRKTEELKVRLATFTAGQVAYHLGIISDKISSDKLIELCISEEDFWIKRCLVIGMMFGGNDKPYHDFIDAMRAGIEKGDFSLSRRNMAIELGFYGDQEFNKFDPTLDLGGSQCRRFLTRAVIELSLLVEQSNWRLELFNILYLWKHRPVSENDFINTVREIYSKLENGVSKVELINKRHSFPEIQEAKEMLQTLKNI